MEIAKRLVFGDEQAVVTAYEAGLVTPRSHER
jgi:hypothetical protein